MSALDSILARLRISVEDGMSFFDTIKFRLSIWYVTVIILVVLVFGSIAYFFLSYSAHRSLDESMKSRVVELETSWIAEVEAGTFGHRFSEVVFLFDMDGRLLMQFGPGVVITDISAFLAKASAGEGTFITTTGVGGESVRLYASLFSTGPDTTAIMMIGRPTTAMEEMLARLRSVLIIAGLFVVTGAGIFGLIRTSRELLPVNGIATTARQIGAMDLSRRIAVYSKDELGRLAATLNGMIERLEEAFKRQRQFTADASHELRTPLAVISAESTLALTKERTVEEYRGSLELISHEAGRMSEIIEELLFLARGDAGEWRGRKEVVNLSQLLVETSREMEVLCQDRGLDFRVDLPEDLMVRGDRASLRRLFVNLLHNAVRYTPMGAVTLSGAVEKGMVVVVVSDTGIGISEEHLPLIFERFHRVDRARSGAEGGSGLGLPIAKQIAEAHGGEIKVESRVGEGSAFHVLLPL